MFEETELTPTQEKQWDDTMSLMQWTCPGFRHLWYKLLAERNNNGQTKYAGIFTKEIGNACTDGKNIMFNPDWFFALSLPERLYVCGHEVLHNVYRDVEFLHACATSGEVPMNDGKPLPFDMETMQQAMDYRINALLDVSGSAGKPLGTRVKNCGNYDPETSANDALLDVYKRHYKKKPDNQGSGQGGGQGSGDQGFDSLAKPGASTGQQPDQAAAQRNDQQWRVELDAARTLDQMRHQGKSPGALQRLYDEILSPEVDWRDHIRAELTRHIGTGTKNWMKPDRRFVDEDIYLPSPAGYGAGWIVVYGDTSGSIAREEITSYIAELSGILADVRPRRLTILWGDTQVAHIDEVAEVDDLRHVKPKGGGGSDSRPMFDWVAENRDEQPECFIGFTDGMINFPQRAPHYHVIWCSVCDAKYPFGEVVRIRK